MAVCPKCKGSNLTRGVQLDAITSVHAKCNDCGTVVWLHEVAGYPEHGYCGSPNEHWIEPREQTMLEKLQQSAKVLPKPIDHGTPF